MTSSRDQYRTITERELNNIKDVKEDLRQVREERETLLLQMEQIKGERDSMLTERDSLKGENTRMVSEIQKLTDDLAAARQNLVDQPTSQKIEEYLETIKRFRQENSTLNAEVEGCQSECASKIEKLKAEFDDKKEQSDVSILGLETRIKILEQELEKEQNAHRQTKDAFTRHQQEAADIQLRLSRTLTECEDTCKNTTDALKRAFEEDVARRDAKFEATKEALARQNEELSKKFNEANAAFEKEKTEHKRILSDVRDFMQKEGNKLIDDHAKERTKLKETHQNELDQIRLNVTKAVKAEIDKLNAKIAQTEQRFNDVSLLNQKIQETLSLKNVENDELKARIESLIKSQEYIEGEMILKSRSDDAKEKAAREDRAKRFAEQEEKGRMQRKKEKEEQKEQKEQRIKAKEKAGLERLRESRQAKGEIAKKEYREEKEREQEAAQIEAQRERASNLETLKELKGELEKRQGEFKVIQQNMVQKDAAIDALKKKIPELTLSKIKTDMISNIFSAANKATAKNTITDAKKEADRFKLMLVNDKNININGKEEIRESLDSALIAINFINNTPVKDRKKNMTDAFKQNKSTAEEAFNQFNKIENELSRLETGMEKYADVVREAQRQVNDAQDAVDSFAKKHGFLSFSFRSKRSPLTKKKNRSKKRSPLSKKKRSCRR
jgi:hypothetical protein